MPSKDIYKEGGKEMKNAIHLDQSVAKNEDFVRGLCKRFESVIKATDGVLSGNIVWRNFYHGLGVDITMPIENALDTAIKKMID